MSFRPAPYPGDPPPAYLPRNPPPPARNPNNPRLYKSVAPKFLEECPDPEPQSEPTLKKKSLATSVLLIKRMKACEHRLPKTDCGCGVAGCALGKGRAGMVSHADCFQCLEGVATDETTGLDHGEAATGNG